MTGARILVVEDEAPIRRFLRIALEAAGHVVSEAATARDGVCLAALENPAVLIFDLGLPAADDLSVLKAVREWSQLPVLVLSVRSKEASKVSAPDAGAQDYMTKPLGARELRAPLRDRPGSRGESAIELVGLRIDVAERRAALDGRDLRLTRREFDLLWLVASHRRRLVTGAMILRTVCVAPRTSATPNTCASTWANSAPSSAATPPTRRGSSPSPAWGTASGRSDQRRLEGPCSEDER